MVKLPVVYTLVRPVGDGLVADGGPESSEEFDNSFIEVMMADTPLSNADEDWQSTVQVVGSPIDTEAVEDIAASVKLPQNREIEQPEAAQTAEQFSLDSKSNDRREPINSFDRQLVPDHQITRTNESNLPVAPSTSLEDVGNVKKQETRIGFEAPLPSNPIQPHQITSDVSVSEPGFQSSRPYHSKPIQPNYQTAPRFAGIDLELAPVDPPDTANPRPHQTTAELGQSAQGGHEFSTTKQERSKQHSMDIPANTPTHNATASQKENPRVAPQTWGDTPPIRPTDAKHPVETGSLPAPNAAPGLVAVQTQTPVAGLVQQLSVKNPSVPRSPTVKDELPQAMVNTQSHTEAKKPASIETPDIPTDGQSVSSTAMPRSQKLQATDVSQRHKPQRENTNSSPDTQSSFSQAMRVPDQQIIPNATLSAMPAIDVADFDRDWPADIAEVVLFESQLTERGGSKIEAMATRAELPRHVAQQLAEIARQMPERPIELALNPDELGRVRMTFSMSDGGINVAVVAELGETMELLRRHIDTLAQEFRNLGFRDVSFDFSRNGQENTNGDDTDQEHNANSDTPPAMAESQTPIQLSLEPQSGLNLRL